MTVSAGTGTAAPAAPASTSTDPAPASAADALAGVSTTDAKAAGAEPEAADAPKAAGAPKAADALKADVAAERDKRQAAQAAATEAEGKLAAVLSALGLGAATTEQTPEQIAKAAQASDAESRRELAVYRNAPPGTDVNALLDSRAFLATLQSLDPADGPAIRSAIVAAVKDRPQYQTGRSGAGTSDAAAAGDPGTGPQGMDALIRARR